MYSHLSDTCETSCRTDIITCRTETPVNEMGNNDMVIRPIQTENIFFTYQATLLSDSFNPSGGY